MLLGDHGMLLGMDQSYFGDLLACGVRRGVPRKECLRIT